MRRLLALLAALGAFLTAGFTSLPYAPVVSGTPLNFPQDFGSHPGFRTEWWYLTGWLADQDGQPLGFQITFFRTRPDVDTDNPSHFSARQILIAHCALSDPKRGRLFQDQRVRREAPGLVQAAVGDTDVALERWTLARGTDGYMAHIDAAEFAMELKFRDTQPPLRNGDAGFSRKGPAPTAASYYYSLPHLKVSGGVSRQGTSSTVTGEAWLDHEWSSEYLDAGATGWEWTGINLSDGGALMAFRIRGTDGTRRWAGGTLRRANGSVQVFSPEEIDFQPTRYWTSPRTAVRYPVQWQLRAGERQLELKPLMDDQENDTRLSTGAIYWEGAVDVLEDQRPAGRGYLELTGYGERLKLP